MKQSKIANYLGKTSAVIEKPEYSYTANAILNAYNDIARGRRYEQGVPLTLSPHDLMAYIQMNELPCEQDLFCEAIFMLDNDFIDEHRQMSERRTAVQGSKKRPS